MSQLLIFPSVPVVGCATNFLQTVSPAATKSTNCPTAPTEEQPLFFASPTRVSTARLVLFGNLNSSWTNFCECVSVQGFPQRLTVRIERGKKMKNLVRLSNSSLTSCL